MRHAIFALTLLLPAASNAQVAYPLQDNPIYRTGFCDAVRAMQRNREHYRDLLHFPRETKAESMARIYEKWPPRPPAGYEAGNIVKDLVILEMAGIDLYVMLPDQDCK